MGFHVLKPHCFCCQPATLIPTADHGLVYECHFTDTAVWNYHPANSQMAVADFWNMVAPLTTKGSITMGSQAHARTTPVLTTSTTTTTRATGTIDNPSSPTLPSPNRHTSPATTPHWPGATSIDSALSPSGTTTDKNSKSNNNSNNNNTLNRQGTRPRICGFHFHAQDWSTYATMFDKQVFESPKTEALSSVYYSQHYQDLAKNYPELHYQVVLKARTSACEAQLASVTQWLGWEAAMGYPTLVAGEPPNCFCNRPMVLCTMRYSTFESSSSPSSLPTYYCEERLKTNTKGCTRFLAVKTTRPLRQLAQPYHAIVADLVQRIHEEPQAQIETATTDGVVSLSAVQSTRLEPNDRTLTRELVVIESDEDRDCDFDVGVASRDGEEQVQDLQLSCLYGRDTTTTLLPSQSSSTTAATTAAITTAMTTATTTATITTTATSSSTSSDDNDDDLEAGLTSRLQKLTQQDQARIERQAAKMKAKEEYLKSQDAIEVWTGSRDRLQAQIESQEQLGLHNLELKCLACREGAIEYAVAPCYHMAMCSNCICSLKDCILCSVKIHGVQRVFWG